MSQSYTAGKHLILLLVSILLHQYLAAQVNGAISGIILDKNTQKPIMAASVLLKPSGTGSSSDSIGRFRISGIPVGTYSLEFSALGYSLKIINNVVITSGNENNFTIEMEPAGTILNEVLVSGRKASARATSLESPLSIQRLTTEDIKANPGGNFDISRVIQSLPGVGGGVGGGGFRNDIIIRGGAPSENVFYLDGIEVPLINHFSTQGSGGGPQGILNVSFIEDVKLSSSAFDARYDNALSSVFQFKQKNGNPNRLQGNLRLSATELAVTLDGPASPKTSFLVSARRSYLQLLFQLIDLPIRPNYWDFQFKTTTRINEKTTLQVLGIGAIDEFRFAAPKEATPEKLYAVNSSPLINQWNYTVGASIKRLTARGFLNLAISRNTLNNKADKYLDNEEPTEDTRTFRINSRETENKLRIDQTLNLHKWKLTYGASAQYIQFNNEFFQQFRPELRDEQGNILQPAIELESTNSLNFLRYGAFVQSGRKIWSDRLAISAGIRIDGNSAGNSTANPLKQWSPRISASYALSDEWNFSTSYGLYYRLPSYTQLAYQQLSTGQTNPGDYIRSSHIVAGFEWLPSSNTRFTLEGFYKRYSNYPVSILDGISLANKGTEFGAIGNELVNQEGKGRVTGVEFFAQQKLSRRFFGILSYTYYKTSFTGLNEEWIRASWDNRHLLSLTAGYKLKRNWEIGLKFRYQGAAPYTPFDLTASQLNYLTLGTGVFDFNRTNSLELPAFHASDLRVDKKWNYRRFTLDLYLDIQNWYNSKNPGIPQYTFRRTADNAAFQTTDGQPIQQNGSNAIPVILANNDGSLLPTIGFIVEF